MSNSIYNLSAYNASLTYSKHDIVIRSGSYKTMTLNNQYLYCLEDGVTGTFDDTKWGGYILDDINQTKPHFIWVPNYQSSVKNAPKTRVLKFDDGYESRIPNAINNNLIEIDLQFEGRTLVEITAITHFLTERNAAESFVWAGRPPYSKNLRYVVREWNDSESFVDNFTLTVKFEQVVN